MENVITHLPKLLTAIKETFILLIISSSSAVFIGLPLGTLLYLSREHGLKQNKMIYFILNTIINIVRSFPFLLFIFAMIPLTRLIVGTSLGTIAASVPMSIVAATLYARFVEQSLLEVPPEIIDTGLALGANTKDIVFKFLYVEARSSLILGLTSALVSFISYSTVMGVVGGGGIGDFAMTYGYQRYEVEIMFVAIVIMICFVQIIQWTGNYFAKKLDRSR